MPAGPTPPPQPPLTPLLSLFLSCSFFHSLYSSSGLFWGIPLCRELALAPPRRPPPSRLRTLPLPLCTLAPARNSPEQPWRKDRPPSACLFLSLFLSLHVETTLQAPAAPCRGGRLGKGRGRRHLPRDSSQGKQPQRSPRLAAASPALACSVDLIPYHVPAGLACDVFASPVPAAAGGSPSPAPPEEGSPSPAGEGPPRFVF